MFVPIKLRSTLVKVIDNFLSQQQFDKLQSDIISIHFPWYFQTGVTNDGVYDDSCLLTHVFYDNDMVNSPGLPIVQPLLNMISIEKLLRVKANLYPNNGHFIHHKKHKDFEFDHSGLLFSINTNNGHTILGDGTQVQSIENRALFFNPGIDHQSTSCTDQKFRVNILINFL